jgi:hypothetical protein
LFQLFRRGAGKQLPPGHDDFSGGVEARSCFAVFYQK